MVIRCGVKKTINPEVFLILLFVKISEDPLVKTVFERNTVKTKYRHIQFDLVNGRWYCYTKDGKTDLGQIYYDPAWKCYVWVQKGDVQFDMCCLADVISFGNQLRP